jgi:hypothetical protein
MIDPGFSLVKHVASSLAGDAPHIRSNTNDLLGFSATDSFGPTIGTNPTSAAIVRLHWPILGIAINFRAI